MKSGQQIEQIETELQELLQSVMQAPLSPLTHTLQSLQSHLDEVEDLVKEIKNEDLMALSLNSQDTEKQIKSLKSSIEGTPRDIQEALHPLLQQELKSLEQSYQANIDQLQSDLKTSAVENDRQLLQSLAERISAVSTSVEELQAALATQSQQASSFLDQAAQTLTIRISEQSASISRLQATLEKQAEQAALVLEKATRELVVEISALAEQVAQQQTVLTVQSEQMSRLQQQQSSAQVKFAEQAQRLLQPMRRWLTTAAVVAGLGLLGTMALVVHQFY